jgi:hypothetical protein
MFSQCATIEQALRVGRFFNRPAAIAAAPDQGGKICSKIALPSKPGGLSLTHLFGRRESGVRWMMWLAAATIILLWQ